MPRHVFKHQQHVSRVVAEGINIVPGLRTSATFFAFLRSNLILPPSTLNSTTSTPVLNASSSQALPPLLPSSLATMSSIDSSPLISASSGASPAAAAPNPDPLDGIPPLTTEILTREDDKIAALKLVADSIAQQRQHAAKAVILHPLTLAAWLALLAILSQFLYRSRADLGVLFTSAAGVTMACLVGVRALTGGYLALAEAVSWDFVRSENGEEDVLLGSRYGDELIGALVLRLEKIGGRRKGGGRNGKGGNGVVRAWTVRNRYRGKGVGTELLEVAVRVTRERLGRDAGVGFAAAHANSTMMVPELFNGGFRRREIKAARMLEGVVAGMERRRR